MNPTQREAAHQRGTQTAVRRLRGGLEPMNPLVHFRWYRRWRGGVWGHHSALLHPWKTWTRFDYRPDDFSERLGDEDWRALPPPNFCEACAMDIATCDCASPRPAVVVRVPPNVK